jgi:hypothetical protein
MGKNGKNKAISGRSDRLGVRMLRFPFSAAKSGALLRSASALRWLSGFAGNASERPPEVS